MKGKFIFRMAVVWMTVASMVACSGSDDITTTQTPEQPELGNKVVTLTGTLAGNVTRAINADGTTAWAEGEEIAVYYKMGDGKYSWSIAHIRNEANNATAGIDQQNSHVAEFKATLNNPANNTQVWLVYPAVRKHIQDGTFQVTSADQAYQLTGIESQSGTLDGVQGINAKWDVAVGSGTMIVSGNDYTATLDQTVTMENQLSICKFELKDGSNNAIVAKSLRIFDGDNTYVATPNQASSTYYVAMKPVTGKNFSFIATTTSGTEYVRDFSSQTLVKGEYNNAIVRMVELDGVDLGLSVRWASMNVGASSESDYGDYFAWGETSPNNTWSWEANKFYINRINNYVQVSKYCTDSRYGQVDELTCLEPDDDAATANWGERWRMPTYDELNELFATKESDNYTWEKDGSNGWRITYNVNGNHIYLPAAGSYLDDYPNGYEVGNQGQYWSSTLRLYNGKGATDAYFMFFYPEGSRVDHQSRRVGIPVRPVRNAN